MNKAEKLAEEYWQNELKNNPDGFYVSSFCNQESIPAAVIFGWDACEKMYRDASEEFDFHKFYYAYNSFNQDFSNKNTFGICEIGARYQHAQDQLKYQVLFSAYSKLDNINIELNQRIMDLKAEIENSNKFAQEQENRINTLAFEKTKETQAYVLRMQELEAENAKLKARYEVKYEGRS